MVRSNLPVSSAWSEGEPVTDARDLRVHAALLQQRADQLGKVRLVFQMQNVQAFVVVRARPA